MKKSTLINLIVIVGLLILCVMTLTAIYATTPDSSVLLLLDENFTDLDEEEWRHEVAECTEDGNEFQYGAADGFAADGILHFLPNLTSPEFRIRREAPGKCHSCAECSSSLFTASLATKRLFHASSGVVQVRAKFRRNNWLRFRIAVTSNSSEWEHLKNSAETAKATDNDFARLEIIFESAINRTLLKSAVTDNDFHVYEIEWNSERITLSADQQKVEEKRFWPRHRDRNCSSAAPFYLSVGVDFGAELLEPPGTQAEDGSSTEGRNHGRRRYEEESILEVDYIRLLEVRTGSEKWILG